MHGPQIRTSYSERARELSRLWRQRLSQLWRVRYLFTTISLLPRSKQRGRQSHLRLISWQRAAALVEGGIIRDVYACRGAITHPDT